MVTWHLKLAKPHVLTLYVFRLVGLVLSFLKFYDFYVSFMLLNIDLLTLFFDVGLYYPPFYLPYLWLDGLAFT